MKNFKIQNKLIGEKNPTFVISEIGINHNGSAEQCAQMILSSKKAGADAVKLQISNPEESYHKKTSSYAVFKKNSLSIAQIEKLKNYAQRQKIIFFATVGDFKSLELIKKLKLPAAKISSGLITNEPLIKEISKLKIPIIISTGMSFKKEIKKAISISKKNNKNAGVAILKCTSLYPAPHDTINLSAIENLKKHFNVPVGYSDHTIGSIACLSAVNCGATIIEKHFTLDKKQKGLDHKLSADPAELKDIISNIRKIEKLKGSSLIKPHKLEIKQRGKMHRRIFASADIRPNEIFTLKNIALKRSYKTTKALEPKYFRDVLGKKAKKKIKNDEEIIKNKIK